MNKLHLNQVHRQHPALHSQRLRQVERGQAIVEFSLIMPILIILLFGVVFFAMAFNLQMILNAAAREGARTWASNRANTSPCGTNTGPLCDPDVGENGFKTNVYPIVRKYINDNGYDGNSIIFEAVQVYSTDVPATQWQQIQDSAEDATKVKLVISYPFYLPTPGFQIELVHLRAEATFKRGT